MRRWIAQSPLRDEPGACGAESRLQSSRIRRGAMLLAAALIAAATVAIAADPATDATAAAGAATLPAPTHRPLRQNTPAVFPEPTDPKPFAGYPGVTPFTVVPQKDKLTFYPCSTCHAAMTPNPQPRKLNSPHPAALPHGRGRIWCLDCHQLNDRDNLHTLSGQSVDFNDAYLVCGQCHFNRQKDWFFGGHGKRAANWQGERVLYNCTHCHDPHDPTLKPREPSAAPPVRAGLSAMPRDSRDGTQVSTPAPSTPQTGTSP